MRVKHGQYLKFSAFHPVTRESLGSQVHVWDTYKASRGFYSRKIVKAVSEAAKLTAKYIDSPLGVLKPRIRIKVVNEVYGAQKKHSWADLTTGGLDTGGSSPVVDIVKL